MSTRSTIKYVNTETFGLHLYSCFVKGYELNIRINDIRTTIKLSEEEAKQIEKEMNE